MLKGRKQLVIKMVKMWCIKLAASCLITAVGGCSQIPAKTSSTGEKPIISSYSAPEGSETVEQTDPEIPIVIWQYQDISVPFDRFTENVGYLNLGMTNKDAPNYILSGHYIYCLSGNNGNYELRRVDLDQLDKSSVAKIQVTGGTVALLDFCIRINTHGETIFYDFDFHEICRSKDIGEEQSIFPYKDGYIVKDGANLRILHLDDENAYRTLDSADYEVTGYRSTGDNTYLILKDRSKPELKARTVYDINRKVYWRRLPENVSLSDIGLAGSVSGKYVVGNFAKMKLVRYAGKNPGIFENCLFDGSRMYFFDKTDRKIKYYCPSRQVVCVTSEAEFQQGATLIGLYGNYVYARYGNAVYYIDAAGLKEMKGDAYIKKVTTDTAKLRKNLEFHYRIKIMNGKDTAKLAAGNAVFRPVTSDLAASSTMNRISAVLKKVNYRFFDVFKQNRKEGICIILSGDIDVVDGKSGVDSCSFTGKDAYYIVLNIWSNDIETALCRELMHTIESRMANADQVFTDWNTFNPEGFSYSEFTAGSAEAPYVPDTEGDANNVYFTDSFACASPAEDRARLFAAVLMPEKYGRSISSYPHLMSKASALKHVLLTYYPALSDSQEISAIP